MTYLESVTLMEDVYDEMYLAFNNNRRTQFEYMLNYYDEIIKNILIEFDMTFNEFVIKYNDI